MRVEAGSLRAVLARGLTLFGAGCVVAYLAFTLQASIYQRRAQAEVDRLIAAPATPASHQIALGEVIGRIEVSRLNLSAAVVQGDDDSMLRTGVGHLPDTPMPWEAGNVAFAAHRDTLFRPLKNIKIDDQVRVVTAKGEFLYRVRKTLIVDPDDVWVLEPTSTPSLTLITCYPFSFIGQAPYRFVVQAERVDAEPVI
jgi:sortase A